jgi:hypothetical protein
VGIEENVSGGASSAEFGGLNSSDRTTHPFIYVSDLTGYKLVIARQLAAVSLHALLPSFSLNELMKLARPPKQTVWSKLVQVMKPSLGSKKNIDEQSMIFF